VARSATQRRIRGSILLGYLFILDTLAKFLPSSTPSGSDSGRGPFPARFFAPFRPAITEPKTRAGEKKEPYMNSIIQLKTITRPLLVALALLCFALSPRVQALVPAPDGGYPNLTTAEGQNALFSLTTGVANTAVGWFSLKSNTDGSFNTGVGAGTLVLNVGDQSTGEGIQNTAVGAGALLSNTIGSFNSAYGAFTLFNNTIGSENTATGNAALSSNTTGGVNTATGFQALTKNTT